MPWNSRAGDSHGLEAVAAPMADGAGWLDQLLRRAGLAELTILVAANVPLLVAVVTAVTIGAVLVSRRPSHPVVDQPCCRPRRRCGCIHRAVQRDRRCRVVVDDAERLIDLVEVFGAVEQGRSLRPDGRIDHADVRIGDSLVMLSEASEQYPPRPCVHFADVPDVDATYRAALAAGATSIVEPTEQSWATGRAASSTRSTTAGGSQPICESSPRPITAQMEVRT